MTFAIYLTQLIKIQISLALQTYCTRQVTKVITNVPVISFYLTLIELKDILLDLILALQSLPTFYLLLSNSSNKILLSNLLRLNSVIISNNFNIKWFLPLLNMIFYIQPNEVIQEKVYTIVTKSTPPPRPLLFHI